MGSTEIAYDKLTGVISLKDSLNPKSEWIPTGHKNIMETKYYLAAKELEQAFNEVRKEMRGKPGNRAGIKEIRVIPASPYN